MLIKNKIRKLLGDSMRSLIGIKNVIMFSAVLLTIGSVSAQLAFATTCVSNGTGNWNNSSNWESCLAGTPDGTTDALIAAGFNIEITGDEEIAFLIINERGTLFIDCDASLLVNEGGVANGNITNHGTFTASPIDLDLFGTFFNSGSQSGLNIVEQGSIVPISTKCSQPIGGTVGSMSTTSLLVAGAQANMGLWSLALVGVAVAVGSGIVYKVKSNKTKEE